MSCAVNTALRNGIICVSLLAAQSLPGIQPDVQLRWADLKEKPERGFLQALPVSRLIVRVFNDGSQGGLFYRNSRFPMRQPLLESYLTDLPVGGPGPELWAWMAGRRFDWMRDPSLFDRQFADGRLEAVPKLDLFNPRAVDLLLQVFRELAASGVSGILIQDDFHIRYNEGFSEAGLAQFTRVTGLPADPALMMKRNTPANCNWQRVKINCLNDVLARILAACRAVNPNVKMGLNVYYESALSVEQGEAWYAHNLRELSASSIDCIYLMAYHRQMRSELHLSEERTREAFQRAVNNAFAELGPRLAIKLQARDWDSKEPLPVEELRAYLKLLPAGLERVCFTSVEYEDIPRLLAAMVVPAVGNTADL
jgi:hypothetical protein